MPTPICQRFGRELEVKLVCIVILSAGSLHNGAILIKKLKLTMVKRGFITCNRTV